MYVHLYTLGFHVTEMFSKGDVHTQKALASKASMFVPVWFPCYWCPKLETYIYIHTYIYDMWHIVYNLVPWCVIYFSIYFVSSFPCFFVKNIYKCFYLQNPHWQKCAIQRRASEVETNEHLLDPSSILSINLTRTCPKPKTVGSNSINLLFFLCQLLSTRCFPRKIMCNFCSMSFPKLEQFGRFGRIQLQGILKCKCWEVFNNTSDIPVEPDVSSLASGRWKGIFFLTPLQPSCKLEVTLYITYIYI